MLVEQVVAPSVAPCYIHTRCIDEYLSIQITFIQKYSMRNRQDIFLCY